MDSTTQKDPEPKQPTQNSDSTKESSVLIRRGFPMDNSPEVTPPPKQETMQQRMERYSAMNDLKKDKEFMKVIEDAF